MLFGRLSFSVIVSASSSLVISRAMATTSRIAVAQLCSTSSKVSNLMNVAKCAALAKQRDCKMLFLPECFGFLGESSEQTLQQAEPPVVDDKSTNHVAITYKLKAIISHSNDAHGEIDESVSEGRVSLLDGLRTIAIESGLWISAGGMHVGGAPPGQDNKERVYNTHVVVDNHGEVRGIYRKIDLFDVCIPGKGNLRESATTAPGEELVVCDSPIGE